MLFIKPYRFRSINAPTSLQQYLELFNQDISSFDQALALVALGSKKYQISKSFFWFLTDSKSLCRSCFSLVPVGQHDLEDSCMSMIRRMGLE